MLPRRLIPLIVLSAALVLPAAALAEGEPAATAAATPTTPTTTTPAPAPPVTTTPAPPVTTPALPPKPVPVGGTLAVQPQQVNGTLKAVLAGSKFRVVGQTSLYAPGQYVNVRVFHGDKRVTSKKVRVRGKGKGGTFSVSFTAVGDGRYRVEAVHAATPQMKTIKARPFHLQFVPRHVSAGQRGLAVRLLQNGLKADGYVIGQYGVYDARTQRAVQAFRKMTGLARTFTASKDVFQKLAAGAGKFPVRFPGHGRHVEGDLTHQVLALIGSGGKVERLYTMSSGKPSTPTILGSFRVYSKTPGTNAEGMVYSNYFIRGYAIHGYADVPDYPASHGCLRVPVPDAIPIYGWVQYGTPVDVYYR